MSKPAAPSAGGVVGLYPRPVIIPELSWRLPFIIRGVPYKWVGERLKADDAALYPFPTWADPEHADCRLTVRIIDLLNEEVYLPAEAAAARALRAALSSSSHTPRPRDPRTSR